jgi:hypothetical protein
VSMTRHLWGMAPRWRQKSWRCECHYGIRPNKRRQAVQQLGPPRPKQSVIEEMPV